ncbi:MAG: hypothetical protein K2R98_01350 [Gemmataceae bacterium]|nr:hypothetical protein [Gemmataceae bacterium]
MRRLQISLGVLCTVGLFALSAPNEKLPTPVKWEEDFDEARELARKSGKPLFVVFRCER